MARTKVETNIFYDDVKKKYYVNLDFGVIDGKQVKKNKTFAKLTDARKELRQHQADKTKRTLIIPQQVTVKEWLENWYNDVVVPNRQETTAYAYKNIIDNHLMPQLGAVAIQDLKPAMIQKYYAKMMSEKKLSSNTVLKHHNLLKTALKLAVRQEVININPTDRVEPPKKIKAKIDFYKSDQLKNLLKLVTGDKLEVAVKLAVYLGLRREEIMGITWDNVDFENKKLYIVDAVTMAGSKIVKKSTKNESSTRTLHLADELIIVLQNEKQKQEEDKKIFGTEYQDNNYIICWDDGKPIRPNYISGLFTKFIKDNNLPDLTFHGLRHSFASLTNDVGISMYDTSKMLGHSTQATTSEIYTHIYDDTHEEENEKIAKELR